MLLAASPSARSSRHLAQKVQAAIRAQLGRVADKVSVDCDEGEITLFGSTGSFYQRQLVIHAAQSAADGHRVHDEIEVTYPRRRSTHACAPVGQ